MDHSNDLWDFLNGVSKQLECLLAEEDQQQTKPNDTRESLKNQLEPEQHNYTTAQQVDLYNARLQQHYNEQYSQHAQQAPYQNQEALELMARQQQCYIEQLYGLRAPPPLPPPPPTECAYCEWLARTSASLNVIDVHTNQQANNHQYQYNYGSINVQQ